MDNYLPDAQLKLCLILVTVGLRAAATARCAQHVPYMTQGFGGGGLSLREPDTIHTRKCSRFCLSVEPACIMVRKVKAIGFQGAERSLTGLAATERQRSAESGSGSGNLWAGIRKVSTAGTLLVVLAAYMMYTMSSERRQVARRFGRGHIAATPNPTIDGDVHRATAALTTRTAITATETVPAQLTEATTTVGGFPPRKADHRDRQREQVKRASAALIPEPTGCERTEQSSGWRSPTIRHIQTQLPKLFNYKAEDSSLVYRLRDLLCGDQGSWYKPDRNCVGKCCATTCLMPWEPGMHAPVSLRTHDLFRLPASCPLSYRPPIFEIWRLSRNGMFYPR